MPTRKDILFLCRSLTLDSKETILPSFLTNVSRVLGLILLGSALTANGATRVVAWGAGTHNWGYDLEAGQSIVPADLTNAVAVAAGEYHSLALTADGRVVAWGWNGSGQTNVPPDATNVVAIAAGNLRSLALRADGTLVCWGGGYGMGVIHRTNLAAIATGYFNDLGVKVDGTVMDWGGWGVSLQEPTPIPPGLTNIQAVAGGYRVNLALRADGKVMAWHEGGGFNTNFPSDWTNMIAIAAFDDDYLGLKADGTVAAWGNTDYGHTNVPPEATNIISIAANERNYLALSGNGTVIRLWGVNDIPMGLTNVIAVAAGWHHNLVLTGESLPFITSGMSDQAVLAGADFRLRVWATGVGPLSYQWRANGIYLPGQTNATLSLSNLQLNQSGVYSLAVSNRLGSVVSREMALNVVPLQIAADPKDRYAYLGGETTFEVGVNGQSPFGYIWRFNGTNFAFSSSNMLLLTKVQFADAGPYTVVVTNAFGAVTSAVANLSVGRVAVWGSTSWYGTNYSALTNVPAGLTNVLAIAAGVAHCMALKGDGTVAVWGIDAAGLTNVPPILTNAIAIATGERHALALRMDRTVCAWGDNSYDQTDVPADLTNVVAVAANRYGSLAMKADGTVVLWGYHHTSLSPEEMPVSLTNMVAISMGNGSWDCEFCFGLVLSEDGSVARLGYDISNCTARIPTFTNAIAIADGDYHSLALRADGSVVVQGSDSDGLTNAPPGLSNVVAVAVNDRQSFALKADGTIVNWGWSYNPPPMITNVVSIAGANNFGMALIGDGPPTIQAPFTKAAVVEGKFCCTVPSRSGRVYQLQYKNRLDDTTWSSLPLVPGHGRALVLTDSTSASPARFYRVREW